MTVRFFTATSPMAQHPQVVVTVPAGYKIIAGGAQVNWSGAGNLLTASFPRNANQWEADSKDADIASPATIKAWAIALYDPNNQWAVARVSATSGVASWPVGHVQLPAGYVLTGGGAQANWHGAGSYLTATYPDSPSSWGGAAKDHIHADPSSITVYAIGIRPITGPLPTSMILATPFSNAPVAHPGASINAAPPGYRIISGGAVDYWGGAGNLLVASSPTPVLTGWGGAGKDHEVSSPATLGVFAVAFTNVYVLP